MPKLLIEGRTVDFETMPTEEEIDEVASSIKGGANDISNNGIVSSNRSGVMDDNSKNVRQDIEQQNFWGQTFNVPAATTRAAMMAKPALKFAGPFAGSLALSGLFGKEAKDSAKKAALRPSDVPTFQKTEFDAAVDRGSTGAKIYGATVKGTVEDMWADPAGAFIDAITLGVGKVMKGIKAGKEASKNIIRLNKAIKPASTGKTFRSSIVKYKNKLALAVDSILENSDNIQYVDEVGNVKTGIPENLDQLSSAITQTKSRLFDEYTELATQAGEQGAKVDLTDVAEELLKVSEKAEIKTLNPALEKEALSLADRLLTKGTFTIKEADEAVKSLNNSLNSFYKTGVPRPGTSVELDALVRNQIAKKLDEAVDVISKKTGETYQQLKNRYGALREIEDPVNKRLFAEMKKPNRGIADLTDVFTAADIVAGVTGNSPILITRGIVGQVIKGTMKRLADPNVAIKNVFKTMQKIKEGKTATPGGVNRIIGAVTPQVIRQNQERKK